MVGQREGPARVDLLLKLLLKMLPRSPYIPLSS
jgi:hypothetical protein